MFKLTTDKQKGRINVPRAFHSGHKKTNKQEPQGTLIAHLSTMSTSVKS